MQIYKPGDLSLAHTLLVSCVFSEADYRGIEGQMPVVRSLVCRVGATSIAASEEARRLLALDDTNLLDVLARKVLTQARERLAYLASNTVTERISIVRESLAELVLQECAVAGAC